MVRTLTPNFTVLALKMWAYTAKIAKICNFLYKFAQKGYTPLSDFFLQKLSEGVSQVRTLRPNFTSVTLKMWAYNSQNR